VKGNSILDNAQVITEEVTLAIAQVRQGNTNAFTEIVEKYQSAIVRYLYRMTGDYETAKDLAQDTFVNAYKGIFKTDSELSFKAWLYRIATNNALQYNRRRKIISFISFSDLSENSPVLKDSGGNSEDNLLIRQTLAKIPYDQRICLVLHYIEGFKYREIAEILDITKEAVSKRVARGGQQFQGLYGGGRGDEMFRL
jgi:RNA polymerase sigma-70 factor (ECF subfamily)